MNWHKPDLLPAPAACRTRQPSASSAAFAAELARRRALLASASICRRARWDLRGSTSATLVGASMATQRHSQAATHGITLTGAPRPHCRTRSKARRSCLTQRSPSRRSLLSRTTALIGWHTWHNAHRGSAAALSHCQQRSPELPSRNARRAAAALAKSPKPAPHSPKPLRPHLPEL